MNYYIADLHFNHANIIRYSKRPFADVEEMNRTLVQNWNAVVTPEDDVYILGDFYYKGANPLPVLRQLQGRKHLVVGNHDGKLLADSKARAEFVEIRDILSISDGNQRLILCHYPMAEWNGYFRGVIHLYGHIHNITENDAYRIMKSRKNAYNTGADILGFTPRTLHAVIECNRQFFAAHEETPDTKKRREAYENNRAD